MVSGCALILGAGTRELRAAVGPSAWCALEELCLRAELTEHGWVATGGVRDLGAGMGVTKDTAARAVTVLLRAGLILRHRLETETRRRAAYLIRESTDLLLCLDDRDGVLCPEDEDTNRERRLPDARPHSPDVERVEAPVCSKREDTDECRAPRKAVRGVLTTVQSSRIDWMTRMHGPPPRVTFRLAALGAAPAPS